MGITLATAEESYPKQTQGNMKINKAAAKRTDLQFHAGNVVPAKGASSSCAALLIFWKYAVHSRTGSVFPGMDISPYVKAMSI